MDNKPTVSLIIPIYNEEKTIKKVILDVKDVMKKNYENFEIIVVEDCSTDDTQKICRGLMKKVINLKIIYNSNNMGKTESLKKAFGIANSKIIAFIDGDSQYNPSDLPKVINKVLHNGYDICSGKRKKRQDPLSRRIASKMFNLFSRTLFNLKVSDINCGLKAIKKDVLTKITIEYTKTKWFLDLEILAKAHKKGFKITQIGINHRLREGGTSKIKIIRTGLETLFYGFLLKTKLIFKND